MGTWTLRLGLLLSLVVAGCDSGVDPLDGAVGADATPVDATSGGCGDDDDCDDALFCNGVERCDPEAGGADADGCVAAVADPCTAEQTCSETEGRCMTDCDVGGDSDGDGFTAAECGGDDCDDADDRRSPGGTEVCDANDLDEDCDPLTFGATDADGDTHVDAACCNVDDGGAASCGDDCDDARDDVGPGMADFCDERDNDCDGAVDENPVETFHPDTDRDGYGAAGSTAVRACARPSGHADNDDDCDDARGMTNPSATEACGAGGHDDNCNGVVDEGCACVAGASRPCGTDVGLCSMGTQSCIGGVWESGCSGGVTPASEVCDSQDNDCDGNADELPEATATCTDYPSSAPACAAVGCTFACDGGYDDCDDTVANGCEVLRSAGARQSDDLITHCGGCGTSCSITSNQSVSGATCSGGTCGMTCSGTRRNCDGNFANGCEADFASVATCGSCGNACPSAPGNGTMVCVSGTCTRRCNGGYMLTGTTCVALPPPRLIAPMSTSIATSTTPLAYWVGAAPTESVELEVCVDPNCSSGSQRTAGLAVSGSATMPLRSTQPLVYYWRARGWIGGGGSPTWSPQWQFRVWDPGATQPSANGTTWGSELELNRQTPNEVAIGQSAGDSFHVYANSGASATTVSSPDGATGSFGVSVASAGDVNGDGYGDLIVGACGPGAMDPPDAASCRNTAYVYHGGASGIGALSTRIQAPAGTPALSGFGYSVASAGDVNRDGYGDVIIGAYWTHRAYLFYGSSAGVTATGHDVLQAPDYATEGYFGLSVAAGDINGDRFSDVIIGRPLGASPRVFVFCGGAGGIGASPCGTYAGPAGTVFGLSVSVTDFSGDGIPDVVGSGHGGTGLVQIFYGNTGTLNTTADVSLSHPLTGYRFGQSVAGLGDFDGDARGDIAVGETAPGNTPVVRIYRGASPVPTFDTPYAIVSPPTPTANFGRFVAPAGNHGGSGNGSDFVVGACDPNRNGVCSNTAWVFYGGAHPLAAPRVITGTDGFGLGANR